LISASTLAFKLKFNYKNIKNWNLKEDGTIISLVPRVHRTTVSGITFISYQWITDELIITGHLYPQSQVEFRENL